MKMTAQPYKFGAPIRQQDKFFDDDALATQDRTANYQSRRAASAGAT